MSKEEQEPEPVTTDKPASKPAAKPASKPAAKPASKPAAKPASKPAGKTSKEKSSGNSNNNNNTDTATPETKSTENAIQKAEAASKALADAELAVKEALERARIAKEEAEAAAAEEYKSIAAEVKAGTAKKSDYTFKRQGEEIFRRDMGEPEFFLAKKDRFPRPILTQAQQESLTRQAEIPRDQTPAYVPEHVLSPEFAGVSNYEHGVDSFLQDNLAKLEKLKNDSTATAKEIQDLKNEITYLESLHENYYIGMNVFRTAKGGRDKLKV